MRHFAILRTMATVSKAIMEHRPTEFTPPPKMSNSERAKFYRRQHKERTQRLVSSVVTLRRDVHQLALQSQLLRALVDCEVTGAARDRIETRLHRFFASPQIQVPGFAVESLDLRQVMAHGTDDATVVEVFFEMYGTYPTASLERVYHSIPGNTVLLDTLMHSRLQYPCVARFFFGRNGLREHETTEVDVDWVRGLTDAVGCMHDVAKVAEPFKSLGLPIVCD